MDSKIGRGHDGPASRRSLKWRCRRGMRELDTLLDRYLRAGHPQSEAEAATLDRLLDAEDDLLWDWMAGRARPDDMEVADLVEKIRTCC